MSSIRFPDEHPWHEDITPKKVGVLLVNLGTPEAPDAISVKRYLAEFLSDRRVIELHPWLWIPALHGLVLPLRSKRVAASYNKIWRRETDESPLRFFTRKQSESLGEYFNHSNRDVIVDWAMRYGSPSLPEALADLNKRGCRRILVVPLYPQYSATTTASVIDKVFESLKTMRYQPALRILPPYYDHRDYIEALASSVEHYLANSSNKPDVLIASFHGLPQAYVEAGDPYYSHCATTTRLLRERLGVDENFLRMSFQSRFGPEKWLRPYTDETLIDLAVSGVRSVAVVTPGFAADCLETLEEIAMQNRELFLARGGLDYDYIPCLNDSPAGIAMLAAMIGQELSGWIGL
ncbi:MAG: ferrochelatase [Methylococcales bacterium]